MRRASAWCVAYQARSKPSSGRSIRGRSNLTATTGRRIADGVCDSAHAQRGLEENRVVTVTRDDRCAPEAQSQGLGPHVTSCYGTTAPGGLSCREEMQQGQKRRDLEQNWAKETV